MLFIDMSRPEQASLPPPPPSPARPLGSGDLKEGARVLARPKRGGLIVVDVLVCLVGDVAGLE